MHRKHLNLCFLVISAKDQPIATIKDCAGSVEVGVVFEVECNFVVYITIEVNDEWLELKRLVSHWLTTIANQNFILTLLLPPACWRTKTASSSGSLTSGHFQASSGQGHPSGHLAMHGQVAWSS